jgi:hypothetical protein
MTEHLCVTCARLFVSAPVRYYERPNVCQGCRDRLRQLLAELVDVYAQLDLERLRGHGQRVAGSREPPLPLRIDVLDLLHDVPALLDSWARDWQTYTWALLPVPTVTSLTSWLSVRLEWACNSHPAIDDFAGELHAVIGTVRSAAGLTKPRPEQLDIPCRRKTCDQLTLWRYPGDDRVYCHNPDCQAVYTAADFQHWCQLLTAWPVVAA